MPPAMTPGLDNGLRIGSSTPVMRAGPFVAVYSAMVMVVLASSVAGVALPTIARSFGVGPSQVAGVAIAFPFGLMVALLPAAVLGDDWGRRRVFSAGVAVFTAASMACAFSSALSVLVAARFVQGLGGAAVLALGIALLRSVVGPDRLGRVIAGNAVAVALATAAGPVVGAGLLGKVDWRWLFALLAPVGVLVLVASRTLPAPASSSRAPGRNRLGAPFELLRDAGYRNAVVASALCFLGVTMAMVVVPFYLEGALGFRLREVGVSLSAWPLTVALAAPIAGRISDRMGTGMLCSLGGILMAAGLGGLACVRTPGEVGTVVVLMTLCGLGFGLFNVPNNRNLFLRVPDGRAGAAGGLQGLARLVGQTLGSIVAGVLLGWASAEGAPRLGLGVAALMTLGASAVSSRRRLFRVSPGPAEDRTSG